MLVLGWHGGIGCEWQDMRPGWSTHDGAAVLMRDRIVVAAIEEERLNRVKHSNFFPARAIRRCLETGRVEFSEVDVVAMNFSEPTRQIFPADAGLPSVDLFLENTTETSVTVRDNVSNLFAREFDTDISNKIHFCNHHIAHLWSAWAPSGFDESLVISFDGAEMACRAWSHTAKMATSPYCVNIRSNSHWATCTLTAFGFLTTDDSTSTK